MTGGHFTKRDLKRIRDHGLTLEDVERQLGLFMMPSPYQTLNRPCTPGDGIMVLAPEEADALAAFYEAEKAALHAIKFVPASGAATRMFRSLLRYGGQAQNPTPTLVLEEARAGRKEAQDLITFMEGLESFAFFPELRRVLSARGLTRARRTGQYPWAGVIRSLLDESGLGYALLPKGLLMFHGYPEGGRTAFEEHLVEAVSYAADGDRRCALHVTVSEEHRSKFEALLDRVAPIYGERYGVSYEVDFSVQKRATATLAVDLENRPFRNENQELLFRPGGHGALIENLNDLDADLVFIKNIDNVAPDRLKPNTLKWKKTLGGCLLRIQKKLFKWMNVLSSHGSDPLVVDGAMAFARDTLSLSVPDSVAGASPEQRGTFLMARLNRPLRVCGMVRQAGEPGGGPFWVKDSAGIPTPQIVETAQIDPESREQQAILAASTHFNPVDIVCGIKDWQGRAFDLKAYVDPEAVFISRKSKDGKDLKALEHPGLWNGAMAHWISVFVDVPATTFNPVKTVNDLLRDTHQPVGAENVEASRTPGRDG